MGKAVNFHVLVFSPNRLTALICKRIKGQKNSRVLKAFFRRRKGKLTLLLGGVRESIFESK